MDKVRSIQERLEGIAREKCDKEVRAQLNALRNWLCNKGLSDTAIKYVDCDKEVTIPHLWLALEKAFQPLFDKALPHFVDCEIGQFMKTVDGLKSRVEELENVRNY
jgi:hypothetical protein